MQWVILKHISAHTEEKEGTGTSQHGFTKAESSLTNLNASSDEISNPVKGENSSYNLPFLIINDFRKVFGILS